MGGGEGRKWKAQIDVLKILKNLPMYKCHVCYVYMSVYVCMFPHKKLL